MINKIFNQIKNFFYWGWKLRESHDWDYWFLYEIMYLKMKRMRNAIKNGHIVWSEKNDKKMAEAIELLHRLMYNDYMDNYNKRLFDIINKHINSWWD
jgi:ABC-type arginine transport system ATPase subunit